MTRRALLAVALSLILWPADASADERGTRRQQHADRRCALIGRSYERRGLTAKERARLDRYGCICVDGQWVSGKVYQA